MDGEILHMGLISFLKYSRWYVPEELLTPFRDNEAFFEEEVILLSKCRQHREAADREYGRSECIRGLL